ncbi:MAG: FtsX-like permease family protein [Desulfosarcinaceae bacterium]|nr:FtsX-like permease family protein [Desulfosarcinaceae bacterium]
MTTLTPATYLRLALRQVRRHRRKSIATGGFILVGTAILVVLVGITVGINDAMVNNSVRLHSGHIFIEIPTGAAANPTEFVDAIKANDRLAVLLQRRRFSVLLKSPHSAAPATIYAVAPDSERAATAIAGRIRTGRYPATGKGEILLGADLAATIGAATGAPIDLWGADGRHLGQWTVCGIYTTGIAHFDRGVAYLSMGSLPQPPADGVTEFALFYDRVASLGEEQQRLKPLLPAGASSHTWRTLMPDLVQLIEMNAVSMGILLVLVYGLVGFGISNTFVLTIVERYREFGILKAMGLRPGELEALVFMESFTICLAATLLGLSVGWLTTELMGVAGIDLTRWTSHNRYFLVSGVIHPRTIPSGLAWPAGIALTVSLLAAYLPTRICRRRTTADLLRTD